MANATTTYFRGNANVDEARAIIEVWREGSPLQGNNTQIYTSYVSGGTLLELRFFGSGFGTNNAVVNAMTISFNGTVTMQITGISEYLSTLENLLNQSVTVNSTAPLQNYLSDYYDTDFSGSEGADSIVGWAGHDLISARGGSGADIIGGGDGNDTLVGESGADTLFGGAGNDVLHAAFIDGMTTGGGGNVIWAGSGNDIVHGDNTADVLGGGVGDDTVFGNGGSDVIYGGQDSASDPGTNDLIYGDAGNDTVYGGNGADDIRGGTGNDLIYGGAQADRLVGDAGQDYLWGGAGDDQLFGGTLGGFGDGSADVFAFQAGSGDDQIVDFEVGVDYLDLRFTYREFVTTNDVYNASTQFSDGVLIDLGGGDTAFLNDLTRADLLEGNYFF
jgi:Ca2+-binding RTX toxin-like protein